MSFITSGCSAMVCARVMISSDWSSETIGRETYGESVDTVTSLEQIENTVVREQSGATVHVRDIANVVDGEKERTELTRMNGKPGILLYVYKQSGANTISVSDLVQKQLERVNKSMPDEILLGQGQIWGAEQFMDAQKMDKFETFEFEGIYCP